MKARDICIKKFSHLDISSTMLDSLNEFKLNHSNFLIVVDKNKLVGVLKDNSYFFLKDFEKSLNKKIKILLDRIIKIPCVKEDDHLNHIIKEVARTDIGIVGVENNKKEIIGIIYSNHILNALIELKEEVNPESFSLIQRKISEFDKVKEFKKYKDIVEKNPNMIHSVSKEGIIIEVNETECRALGYSKEEMIGMSIKKLYPKDILKDVEVGFKQLQEKGKASELESVILTKDGRRIPVEINSVSVYDKDNNFLHTRSVLRDITIRAHKQVVINHYLQELKDSKNELTSEINEISKIKSRLEKSNKDLDEAVKLKNELLNMVSHDLKSPLNTIIGLTQLGLDGTIEKTDILRRVKSQGEKTLDLCVNILNSYKIESGTLVLNFTDVDVVSLVKGIIKDFSFLAEQKNININFECAFLSVLVEIDEQRIDQAVRNILSNTIKFSPKNKGVNISLKALSKEGLVNIEFSDKGPGLSKSEIESLFNKSKQLKRKNLSGTGFGLSIVDKVIALHDGKVEVESTPYEKTTFTIILPRLKSFNLVE